MTATFNYDVVDISIGNLLMIYSLRATASQLKAIEKNLRWMARFRILQLLNS
jgi:hypothetical protein